MPTPPKPRRRRSPFAKLPSAKARAFLAAYSLTGNMGKAALVARCSRRSHCFWMKTLADYPEAFSDAREDAGDRLEAEARRRAVTGYLEPVYGRGSGGATVKVGTVRRYSDRLLETLLRGAMPEKYNSERRELSGPKGGPIVLRSEEREIIHRLAADPATREAMRILAEASAEAVLAGNG